MTRPLDHELPSFALRPNWVDGVTERLEWLTDVLDTKLNAIEQRRCLRLTPRRSLECLFSPTRAERTYLDLALNRKGSHEWMVPLWHDRAVLTASASLGASSLAFDGTNREFISGGMAYLVGSTPFSGEAVRISTASGGGLTLAGTTSKAWPAGAIIHPLRRGRIDVSSLSALTNRTASARLRFNLEAIDDVDPAGSDFTITYAGAPVLVRLPNWSGSLDVGLSWLSDMLDGQTGKLHLIDYADRAFSTQQHRWLLAGRAEQMAFRKFLHRLQGKLSALWLPTFSDDLIVAAGAASAATNVDVEKVGLEMFGAPAPGREYVLIGYGGTPEPAKITGIGTAGSAGQERIQLQSGLSRTVAAGEGAAFMAMARLDQDAVEIIHHADTDGAAEATLVFKTIGDARNGSAAGALSIATAEMNDEPCGECIPSKEEIFSNHWVSAFWARDANSNYAIHGPAPHPSIGSDQFTSIIDMHTREQVYGAFNEYTWSFDGITDEFGNKVSILGIDSTGTLWGTDYFLSGPGNRLLISIPELGTGSVTVHGQVIEASGLSPVRCYDLPEGGGVAVVWPHGTNEGTADNYAHAFYDGSIHDYQPVAGTGESWVITPGSIQDEYGDIWVHGIPETTGDISSLYLWRIIENGDSPIVDGFAHITGLPVIAGLGVETTDVIPQGFWANGSFVFYWQDPANTVTATSLVRINAASMTVTGTRTFAASRVWLYLDIAPNTARIALGVDEGSAGDFELIRVSNFSSIASFVAVSTWSPTLADNVQLIDYDDQTKTWIGMGYDGSGTDTGTSIGWYRICIP